MAERKAVNKYYPPEWTPSQGSINKFRGTHALRERARKLHMGILIIRFEMPYNIWCNGCGNHIGMGVRYNAEKTKVGMYYTTPIYKFRMKCHLCTNHFEIQTDPQNLDYVILDGARRQEGRWDPTQNEQIVPEDKEVSKKLALDSMYRLEHSVEDKGKQKSIHPSLAQLEEYKERWKDDYILNKALRQQFRERKKDLAASEEKDCALLKKWSLNLDLLPETAEDRRLASLLKLAPTKSFEEQRKLKREVALSRPLFPSTSDQRSGFIHHIRETKVKALLKPLPKDKLAIVKKSLEEIKSTKTLATETEIDSKSTCESPHNIEISSETSIEADNETNSKFCDSSYIGKVSSETNAETKMQLDSEFYESFHKVKVDMNSETNTSSSKFYELSDNVDAEISSVTETDFLETEIILNSKEKPSNGVRNSLVAFDYNSSSDDESCD